MLISGVESEFLLSAPGLKSLETLLIIAPALFPTFQFERRVCFALPIVLGCKAD